ncbi:RNA-binding protein with multiple splicing 2-like isoform X2 [Sycon ciliatum]|uniref:RNA-binding protein with multiple splicing 2-like isoform X2 n=1 Tax=Sycon ciliatum TaxID=27933 RepID=UPI0020AEA8CD
MDSNGTPEKAVDEEVRTLFVSGLPIDVKPRELDLLFHPYKDYDGSLLKFTSKPGKPLTPVAFCTFLSRESAEKAKAELQGLKFDPDLPQTLRLEFAKSNTKMTRKQAIISNMIATNSNSTSPNFTPATNSTFFEPWQVPIGPTSATIGQLPPLSVAMSGYNNDVTVVSPGHYPAANISPTNSVHLPGVSHAEVMPTVASPLSTVTTLGGTQSSPPAQWAAKMSPCNTLFVANLGTYTTEQELREVFGRFPGFRRLRLHSKGSTPVAFVEFTDETFAHNSLVYLQGFQLLSSERGGIRIEFARNRMGDRGPSEEAAYLEFLQQQ